MGYGRIGHCSAAVSDHAGGHGGGAAVAVAAASGGGGTATGDGGAAVADDGAETGNGGAAASCARAYPPLSPRVRLRRWAATATATNAMANERRYGVGAVCVSYDCGDASDT